MAKRKSKKARKPAARGVALVKGSRARIVSGDFTGMLGEVQKVDAKNGTASFQLDGPGLLLLVPLLTLAAV